MMARTMHVLSIILFAAWPAIAHAADAPDKSGYTFFNPTPLSAMRAFSTDRPTKG